jgi:hypothetical protein
MPSMRSLMKFVVPAVAFGLGAAVVVTAGPLDPPTGAIAPTYKTLSEVEPRTAINATNTPGDANSLYRITQEGSYYLTGNVAGVANKHSILILASNVTIDLNGFTIKGISTSRDGIRGEGSLTNIRIRNGMVRDHGLNGISMPLSRSTTVENVQAVSNGGDGISAGFRAILNTVESASNAGAGFHLSEISIVTDCIAEFNAVGFRQVGPNTRIENCISRFNNFTGFEVIDGTAVSDCTASSNGQHGFKLNGGRITLERCMAELNVRNGFIVSGYDHLMSHCQARQNGQSTNTSGFYSSDGANHAYSNCMSYYNALHGFESASQRTDYKECTAMENGSDGIRAAGVTVRIQDSRLEANSQRGLDVGAGSSIDRVMIRGGTSDGIRINGNGNATIRHCHVQNTGGIGAVLGNGSLVESTLFTANFNNGCTAGSLTVIRGCTFDNNGTSAGTTGHIYCAGNGNLIEDNYIYNGDPGIVVASGGGTIVRRNIVNGTANNYGLIVGGNRVATINTSATLSSTNSNDNFSY